MRTNTYQQNINYIMTDLMNCCKIYGYFDPDGREKTIDIDLPEKYELPNVIYLASVFDPDSSGNTYIVRLTIIDLLIKPNEEGVKWEDSPRNRNDGYDCGTITSYHHKINDYNMDGDAHGINPTSKLTHDLVQRVKVEELAKHLKSEKDKLTKNAAEEIAKIVTTDSIKSPVIRARTIAESLIKNKFDAENTKKQLKNYRNFSIDLYDSKNPPWTNRQTLNDYLHTLRILERLLTKHRISDG